MKAKTPKAIIDELANWLRAGVHCESIAAIVMGPREEIHGSMRRYVADRVLGVCHGNDALHRVLAQVAAEIDKGIRIGVWEHEVPGSDQAEAFRVAGEAVAEIRDVFLEWIDG